MITGLGFTNFQGFEFTQSVRLAPLTLIFGPNSSGKSSILRALRLLSQVSEDAPGLPLNGRHIEMGTFRSAVFNGDEKRNFTLAVESVQGDDSHPISSWRSLFDARRLPQFPATELRSESVANEREVYVLSSKVRSEFEIDASGEGVPTTIRVVHEIQFLEKRPSGTEKEDFRVELVFSRLDDTETSFKIKEVTGLGKLLVRVPTRVRNQNGQSSAWDVPALTDEEWQGMLADKTFDLRRGLIPDEPERSVSISSQGVSPSDVRGIDDTPNWPTEIGMSALQSYLDKLRRTTPAIDLLHIGPLRSISQSFQALQETAGLRPDASNLVSFLAGLSEEEMEQLSGWLQRLTNGRYTIALINADIGGAMDGDDGWRETGALLFQIGLKDHHTKTYISPLNAGAGLSQILPILAALAVMRQGRRPGEQRRPTIGRGRNQKMLIIEQPELHLHPRMQADFAEVLVDAQLSFASQPNRRETSQIIVETHSEALMLRLQKLIRQGKISQTQVSVLFVDQFAGGGNLAQELRLDADGNFKDTWPTSFSDIRWSEQLDDDQ